jgi:uncharacterized SAM-binding protein YcdF (DUF218 family)
MYVVVVPDGLAYDDANCEAIPKPSFVYKAVLDNLADSYTDGMKVLLAPANKFGCNQSEQEVAFHYLANRGIPSICVPSSGSAYIDTRGNARLLRLWLIKNDLWPLSSIHLYSSTYHARRAKLCFAREGFLVDSLVIVNYKIPERESIVPRLRYYRHRIFHRFYEALALTYDFMRFV